MEFLYGEKFSRILGQRGHGFAKPSSPEYTYGGKWACGVAHAIYSGQFERGLRAIVSMGPFLYYSYRKPIKMPRTLFGNM